MSFIPSAPTGSIDDRVNKLLDEVVERLSSCQTDVNGLLQMDVDNSTVDIVLQGGTGSVTAGAGIQDLLPTPPPEPGMSSDPIVPSANSDMVVMIQNYLADINPSIFSP